MLKNVKLQGTKSQIIVVPHIFQTLPAYERQRERGGEARAREEKEAEEEN